MDTMKAIEGRRSIRAYTQEQISEEALARILTAGGCAPVALRQYDAMHLTVIQDKGLLQRISALVKQAGNTAHDPLYGVPTLILVAAKEQMPAPGLDYANTGCMLENMMLAAFDGGIGSVIIWGAAAAVEGDPELKRALSLPEGFRAIAGAGFGVGVAVGSETPRPAQPFPVHRV